VNSTPRWRTSSYTDDQGGTCVEVADLAPTLVGVRDSTDPTGPRLELTPASFTSLITHIKTGALDL